MKVLVVTNLLLLLLLSVSVSFVSVAGHPSRAVAPLPNAACANAASEVTFFSYHVHVLFSNTSETAALRLQRRFAASFGLLDVVDPVSCDDFNTTHGLNPALCLIDNDWGPADYPHGHYGSPACPFLVPEWAAFVPPDRLTAVLAWFMRHRTDPDVQGVDVFVHPNSGCEVYDHRDWPLVGGQGHPLDLSCLHYDCPGCNEHDCVVHGRAAVLAGHTRSCGLELVADRLQLVHRAAFCTPDCARWVTTTLPAWRAACPNNCDLFTPASSTDHALCAATASSMPQLLQWQEECSALWQSTVV